MTTTTPPRRAGTVVWVDLSTTDIDGAIHFYERLLGWHHEEHHTAMGTYVVALVADGEVGGMMSQSSEGAASGGAAASGAAAGVPASWTVVVGVDHLEAMLATARDLGGSVLQSAVSIPGGARIAVIADPAGAALALMESPPSATAMAWGEPGSVCWVECLSRDPVSARHFAEHLFGWKSEDGSGGYVVYNHEGERVGGLMAMPAILPPDVPSHWLVYFGVADAAACTRAVKVGGDVLEPAHEIREGRFAVLLDPAGAVFAVFEEQVRGQSRTRRSP